MHNTFPLLSDQKSLKEGRKKLCEQLKRHFTKL